MKKTTHNQGSTQMKGVLIGRKVLDRFLTALTIIYARVYASVYASYSERSGLKLRLMKLDQVADLVITRSCVAVNQPPFTCLIERHMSCCKARSVNFIIT